MEHPDALNDDFNLSTAESTTVLELAELIWRKIKGPTCRSATCHDDPFEHDVQKRVPRRRRRPSEVLGFEATTTLDEMLDEVIPWIEQAVEDGTHLRAEGQPRRAVGRRQQAPAPVAACPGLPNVVDSATRVSPPGCG